MTRRALDRSLTERRRNAGLTQQRLAWDLGVAISTVRRWEAGEHHPSALHRRAYIRAVEAAEAGAEHPADAA